MNIARVELSHAAEQAMLRQWRDHICCIDRFQTMREYYSLQGWNIEYNAYADCWTIPADQLTFFLLSL